MRELREEAPHWGVMLPRLPRLLSQRLGKESPESFRLQMQEILVAQRRHSRWIMVLTAIFGALLLVGLFNLVT
jgi:ubiquinone biosynthesis protein